MVFGSKPYDDRLTLVALGIVAFALADMSHEGLGHGLATLATGNEPVLLTTCFFTSNGNYSKWIPAAGGLMNVAVGLGSLATLRVLPQLRPSARYFLILVAAFNLFFAFGYPAASGIANVGDWAAVISGLQPTWLWRVLLVVVSVFGYYAAMWLLTKPLTPFAAVPEAPTASSQQHRLDRLTYTPFVAAVILACAAGALNPNGWRTMLTAGLPAAAAAFGLTQITHLIPHDRNAINQETAPPIRWSAPWLFAAVLVALFFIGVLGPGIHFHPTATH